MARGDGATAQRDAPSAAEVGIALLRTAMGALFLAHVVMRLTVITWPVAERFFQSLGIPALGAYMVTAAEAVIGILLVAGRHVRLAALTGAVILLFAIILVHGRNGFFFTNAGGGWEYPAFWMIALMCQSLIGPGRWTGRSIRSDRPRLESER